MVVTVMGRWEEAGVVVQDQVVGPKMVRPCGKLVRETFTWGK